MKLVNSLRKPSPASRPNGFALVLAITLLAFMMLLILSLTTITEVNLRRANNAANLEKARGNALLAAQVALGQLQKYAGADQRVTAPATIAYPQKDFNSPGQGEMWETFRSNATGNTGRTNWTTYLTPNGRENFDNALSTYWEERNPHWTGIWDSSRRDAQGNFEYAQSPRWLISGNEFRNPGDADYLTPDQTLNPASEDIIYLVGETSAVRPEESFDGYDGRVLAPKVTIEANNATSGRYAYWTGDESIKANFSVRDPFSSASPGTVDYFNRLQAPQRVGWENISGFDELFRGGSVGLSPDDPLTSRVITTRQIALLDDGFALPTRQNFHALTGYSTGLFTDTASGGLRRDLFPYLTNNSGLNDSDYIIDSAHYLNDPRLQANNNGGFPASNTNMPTFGDLRDWYQNVAVGGGDGSVDINERTAPVVTGIRMFGGFSREGDIINYHILPQITLWNPYNAALNNATYEVVMQNRTYVTTFIVATEGLSDSRPENDRDPRYGFEKHGRYFHAFEAYDSSMVGNSFRDAYNATSSPMPNYRVAPFSRNTEITFRFQANFGPGETKVFSIDGTNIRREGNRNNGQFTIELSNDFAVNDPGSFYLPVLRSVGPIPGENGGTVRFYGWRQSGTTPTENEGNSHGFYHYELYANGQLVQKSDNFGGNPNHINGAISNGTYNGPNGNLTAAAARNIANALDGDQAIVNALNLTREIVPLNQFLNRVPTGLNENSTRADSSIFSMLMAHQKPFIYASNSEPTNWETSTHHRFPGFSAFNLSARNTESHPLTDQGRGINQVHNGDNFKQFMVTNGEVQSSWDNGSLFYNPSTGAMQGYSIINPRWEPGSEFERISNLAIRQVRRPEANVFSLAQLQQVNLSKFLWQPAFPIGNSFASPYIDRQHLAGMARPSYRQNSTNAPGVVVNGGNFNTSENYSIDISYLLNESLWDSYFLSSIQQGGGLDLDDFETLPNSRIRLIDNPDLSDFTSFNDADSLANPARWLQNVGAFNVNSTSVEGWKALLTAFRELQLISVNGTSNPASTVPVSRSMRPLLDPVTFTFNEMDTTDFGAIPTPSETNPLNYNQIFAGFRYLDDDMIQALAERIVDEVRLRGPFLSLSDFVNRRLVGPDDSNSSWQNARIQAGSGTNWMNASYDPVVGMTGITGAIQRAIDVSGINGGVNYPTDYAENRRFDRVYGHRLQAAASGNAQESPHYLQFAAISHYLDTEHVARAPAGEQGSLMAGAPGFVTQGDILSMIGPALTARGDTFVIRSYGETLNQSTGDSDAEAWLEMVVQRTPRPLTDTNGDWEPEDEFGRQFQVVSFRWLTKDDI